MGDIAVVSGVDSVVPNESEDNNTMLIFQEQHALKLSRVLGVDLTLPQESVKPTVAQFELEPGSSVNVYFVHFDPVGKASKHFTATIVFPNPIVGIAFRMKTLDAGDAVVGRDDVTYPDPGTEKERGLEYPGADDLSFQADHRTLGVDFSTSTSSDQMRVITLVTTN